jgi:hypothetical protein
LHTHQIRLKSLLKEKDFEEHLIEEILTCGRLKKAEKGAYLLSSGMKVAYLPFILSGRLRAYRSDDEGHEITLFYTGSGELVASQSIQSSTRVHQVSALLLNNLQKFGWCLVIRWMPGLSNTPISENLFSKVRMIKLMISYPHLIASHL